MFGVSEAVATKNPLVWVALGLSCPRNFEGIRLFVLYIKGKLG